MTFPVYLINLDGSDERLSAATAQLDAAGLTFERLPAFDGRKLRVDEFPGYDAKAAIRYMGRPMRGGEIGCYLSHLSAAKRIVDSGAPFGIVLEDDMCLPPDAAQTLQSLLAWLEANPSDWHLINLGPNKHKIFTPLARFETASGYHTLTRAHYFPMMASGLLWSRAGVQAFLTSHKSIFAPVDNFLRHWLTHNDKGLALWPPLVTTSGAESDIFAGTISRSVEDRHPLYGFLKQKRLLIDKALAVWHKLLLKIGR